MKLLVKKESWRRFGFKAALVTVALWVAGAAFADRYRFGIDKQIEKCIPGYSVYIIDRKDTALKKDAIYAFSARGLDPLYEDGTQMVKYLRGMPGDQVKVTPDEVLINGAVLGRGLVHAETLNLTADSFTGEATLKDGNFWFMGTSDLSFDSRYWGTVKNDQILGRAYPLF